MSRKDARYDGLGIAVLGLAALIAVLASISGFISPPKPADDTSVQQSMAWANWVMVWVSLGGGMIGLLSLILIYRTLQAAQRSAIAAEEAIVQSGKLGQAQVRAYLIVTSAKLVVNGGRFWIEYSFRNSGETPALNVTTTVQVRMAGLATPLQWREILTLDPEVKNRSDVPSHDDRSARTEVVHVNVAFPDGVNEIHVQRVLVTIELLCTDVFDERYGKPVAYGAFLNSLDEGKHTLYRQTRADGRAMDFDIFD